MRYILEDFFKKGDMLLLGLCALASTYGMILIYTATRWIGESRFIQVQLSATLLGMVIYMILSTIDFRAVVESCWKFLLVFNVGFLALLLTPLGTTHDSGNLNWLSIPGVPVDIQPNEIVKATYILICAHIMSKIQEDGRKISSIPALTRIAAHALLTLGLVAVICGDWGMCVIYIAITLVMMWSAGVAAPLFAVGFAAAAAAIYVVWVYYLPFSEAWDYDYRIMRFRTVIDHSLDPLGIGWQQSRSMLAIGSGKFFGQGYLQGMQTQSPYSNSLPARHTDFIFSVCGEELGFLGCMLLLLLLAAIVLRCIWISRQVDSFFSAYVAMGMAGMLLAQIFFNVGMCLYIMPTMGLTLPFISYGGSSIVTLYASMGIVSSLRSRNMPSWIRDRSQMGR